MRESRLHIMISSRLHTTQVLSYPTVSVAASTRFKRCAIASVTGSTRVKCYVIISVTDRTRFNSYVTISVTGRTQLDRYANTIGAKVAHGSSVTQ